MFESLGRRLGDIFQQLRGKSALTEADITAALRHIRIALLEADVALPAIKALMDDVKEHALGTQVLKSISPENMVIKAVHDSLMRLLDHPDQTFLTTHEKPHIILMAGLQGSGKTTMSAKIATLFKGKKILMASLDIYRPAAQKQLEILGQAIGVDTLAIVPDEPPLVIAQRALNSAKNYDLLIVDTAGRLHIDGAMMEELKLIKHMTAPHEVLLVVDALSGQDGLVTAKQFHEVIGITGVALSRVDGDSRGGVALSLRHATGCPIKVMGLGEQPEQVMRFDPKRLADRILDKGDMVGLVEKASQMAASSDHEAALKRLEKGMFTLEDLSKQLTQLESMGGIKGLLDFLPGMRGLKDQLDQTGGAMNFKKQQAIIGSMTIKERRRPELLNASRKRRIASGSGTDVTAINRLLDHFSQMQKMMKSLKTGMPPKRWGR
jgi:signal recognition particle subunit SRP54